MAASTESRKRRDDPTVLHSPAHLAAVCREAATRCDQGQIPSPRVVVFRRIPGFTVPDDGLWSIDGKLRAAGEVHDIEKGFSLTYIPVAGQGGMTTTNYVPSAAQAVPGSLQVVDLGLNNKPRRK